MKTVADIVYIGVEKYMKEEYQEALKLFKKAISVSTIPRETSICYYNIGLCHYALYNYEAAAKVFEKAFLGGIETAGYDLALALFQQEEMVAGSKYYKYRYCPGGRQYFPKLPLPRAEKLEDMRNQRVLVLNEQGFGDEILFSRNIDCFLERETLNYAYQVYPETLPLFQEVYPQQNPEPVFFTSRNLHHDFVKQFDVWVPAGDLFFMLFNEHKLSYDPNMWHTRQKNLKLTTIGLCWSTNTISKNANERSISIDKFKECLDGRGYNIVSLQKDQSVGWIEPTEIKSFLDTSCIMDKVDLVVTVDTAVAHLAGAKGVPTIVVYDKYLDWRWKHNFYSSVDNIIHISQLPTVAAYIMGCSQEV